MSEKKRLFPLHIYLAIAVYSFLPRFQLTTHSPYWNILFDMKRIGVTIIVLGMCWIAFQKTYAPSEKYQDINLKHMVISAYVMYVFAHFFFSILLAFV